MKKFLLKYNVENCKIIKDNYRQSRNIEVLIKTGDDIMKKIIFAMILILILLCSFSISVFAKNHAFILEKIDFGESQQVYEERWAYPIEVNNYGQIRVILDIQKSHVRSDNEIVRTFDPVPPTSQYFPKNSFLVTSLSK